MDGSSPCSPTPRRGRTLRPFLHCFLRSQSVTREGGEDFPAGPNWNRVWDAFISGNLRSFPNLLFVGGGGGLESALTVGIKTCRRRCRSGRVARGGPERAPLPPECGWSRARGSRPPRPRAAGEPGASRLRASPTGKPRGPGRAGAQMRRGDPAPCSRLELAPSRLAPRFLTFVRV